MIRRIGILLVACSPAAHALPSDHPIERNLIRSAAALERICPDRCGTVQAIEDPMVDYAIVAVLERGFSIIRYSTTDMNRARRQFGEDAALGIFAHEMGHHLDSLLWIYDATEVHPWTSELRADRWAGCMIAAIDANPRPLELFLKVESAASSRTHPPGEERAIEEMQGYNACSH